MSASSSVGDFDLNLIKLRKPLEFADGTIQDTAYTGDGSETLAEVLAVGNNASGQSILGVGALAAQTGSFIVASGASAGATLIVEDSVSGNEILLTPCSTVGSGNPIVVANDAVIKAVAGANAFSLTTDSATTSGLRITDNSITMGAGGALATPTLYFQSVGGDKNYIKGNCAMEGTLDLATNDIANVSQIEFDDGSIQTTAFTEPSSALILNDTTPQTYNLSQPSFGVTNQSPTTISRGIYQATVNFQLLNSSTSNVSFDFFNVAIGSGSIGSILVAQEYTPNFTLAPSDVAYRNVSIVFANSTTQNVGFTFSAGISSGAFIGSSPVINKSFYILTKLADLP